MSSYAAHDMPPTGKPETSLFLELYEHIIGAFLDQDLATLRSCSLVCKALLPVTTFSLFKKLKVDSRALVPLRSASDSGDTEKYQELRRMPRVSTRVRELTLTTSMFAPAALDSNSLVPFHAKVEMKREVSLRAFSDLVAVFPNLRTLRCRVSRFTIDHGADSHPTAPKTFDDEKMCSSTIVLNRPSLQKLIVHVRSTTFQSASITDFLSSFSKVDQLHLEDDSLDRWVPATAAFSERTPEDCPSINAIVLSHLNVRRKSSVVDGLIAKLMKTPALDHLHSIDLRNFTPTFLRTALIDQLILRNSSHLEDLHLGLSLVRWKHHAAENGTSLFPSLAQCSSLRRVDLSMELSTLCTCVAPDEDSTDESRLQDDWRHLLDVVAPSSSTKGQLDLENLRITLPIVDTHRARGSEPPAEEQQADMRVLCAIEWTRLAQVIEQHSQLQSIEICLTLPYPFVSDAETATDKAKSELEWFEKAKKAILGKVPSGPLRQLMAVTFVQETCT